MALTAEVERSPAELNAALKRRVETLVSELLVLDGMTKRGALLSEEYRSAELPAIRRFAARILDALERGAAAAQPWDHAGGRHAAG